MQRLYCLQRGTSYTIAALAVFLEIFLAVCAQMIASSARSVEDERGISINKAAQEAASGCPNGLFDRVASLPPCNDLETCPEH